MTEAKTCVRTFHLLLPPVTVISQSLPAKYLRTFYNETSSLPSDSMRAFSDETSLPNDSMRPLFEQIEILLVYKLYILTVRIFCIYTCKLQWWPPRAFASGRKPCRGKNPPNLVHHSGLTGWIFQYNLPYWWWLFFPDHCHHYQRSTQELDSASLHHHLKGGHFLVNHYLVIEVNGTFSSVFRVFKIVL